MNDLSDKAPKNPLEPEKLEVFINPVTAAFVALAGIFVLYQFGGAILTLAIFGFNFENADLNAVRLLTMGGQILLILLPTLIITKLVYANVTKALRIALPHPKEIGIFAIGFVILLPLLQSMMFVQNFIIDWLAGISPAFKSAKEFVDQIDKLIQSTYGDLLSSGSLFESSFIVFVVSVIPALCEETFFRGFVQKSFEQRFKPVWSILMTAFFFGIYHFNPYGLIALIILGAYFGFAAYLSNSIFIPMILHFLNNFLAVIAYLVFGDAELISSSATANDNILPHFIALLILLALFIWFLILVHRKYSRLHLD